MASRKIYVEVCLFWSILCVSGCLAEIRMNTNELQKRQKNLLDTVVRLENVVHVLEGRLKRKRLTDEAINKEYEKLFTELERPDLFNFKQPSFLDRVMSTVYRRQALPETDVAFSTYLDHDVDNLGAGQAVLFNQILLNDGGGYNQYTGAFTAPFTGNYIFSFFVGQRGDNQILATLSVNGVQKSHAVAETATQTADAQGGNILIVHLSQGDVAIVQRVTLDSRPVAHLEGATDVRLSTFSGFLYKSGFPDEIVGK